MSNSTLLPVYKSDDLEKILTRVKKNRDYLFFRSQVFKDAVRQDYCAVCAVYRKTSPKKTIVKIWLRDYGTNYVYLETTAAVMALKQAFETIGGES